MELYAAAPCEKKVRHKQYIKRYKRDYELLIFNSTRKVVPFPSSDL